MRHEHTTATDRLLHDLAAVGRMQNERPSAAERIEGLLGTELADILRTTLVDASTPGGVQHRAA
jgi:hypothetical protein